MNNMNKRSWYLLKNIFIILVLEGMLLVFFKGISICDEGSREGPLDEQGIEAQQDKKRIQAEKLFLEGQKLIEKAKDENDLKDGFDMISQSISIYNELNDMDGVRNVKKNLSDFLNEMGIALLLQGRSFEALDVFRKTLEFYKKIEAKKEEADTFTNIGIVYSDLGKYQKALGYFEKALDIHKQIGDIKGEGSALGNIGNVYLYLGQYQKALGYYEKALDIKKQIGDIKAEGNVLNNIGFVYSHLGQYQKALDYCEKALDIHKQIGDIKGEGRALGNIGNVYLYLGKYQKALGYYKKALDIHKQIGDIKAERDALTGIGAVYSHLGQYQKALEYHEQALDIGKQIGDIKAEGGALNNIGLVYSHLGQYQKALGYYEKALDIHEQIGDIKAEGNALNNIGLVYWYLGQYQKALGYYEKALDIKKQIGDIKAEGDALNNIGTVYSDLGQYQKALEYFEKALDIHKQIGDIKAEGDALTNIGTVYPHLGQYQKALGYYEKALDIYKQIGDIKAEGGTFNNIGTVYSDLGQHQKALEYHEQALDIGKQIGDIKAEGDALNNIGTVYWYLGQYQKALGYYEKALDIHKQIGDIKAEAADLGNIGNVYSDLGQYEEALVSLRKALVICKNIGIPTGIAEGNIGDILLEQGNIEKASRIFKKLNGPIRTGRLSLLKKEYSDALAHFQKSLKSALTTKNADRLFAAYTGLGLSYEGLGHAHNRSEYYEKAKEYYLKAINLLEEIRDSLLPGQRIRFFEAKIFGFSRVDPYEGLVRVLEHLQDHDSSFLYTEYTKARYFSEAFAARQKDLSFNLPEELASSEQTLELEIAALYQQREKAFKENRMEVYENIENLLKEKKEEKNRLISSLKKEYPEYASLKYPQPLKPSEIPPKPDEYLLEYEVTDKEVYTWLIHERKVIKTQKIPITKEALIELVDLYRSYFRVNKKEELSKFDPETGHRLYNLLLKEMLLEVPQTQHLIIVPDEVLGTLPFEALVVEISEDYCMKKGREGPIPYGIRYVADERSISYYQSATSLATIRDLRQKSKAKRPMLALVDPVFDEEEKVAKKTQKDTKLASHIKYQRMIKMGLEEDFKFPRLEKTRLLAKRLNMIFDGKVDILQGLNATYANFIKKPLMDYRFLFFGTHGILDYRPKGILQPALLLTQTGNPEGQDGFLTMGEIMNLKFDADCCALTACQTGSGKHLKGEGVMCLGRAFQFAGTRSVLMSLWLVSEESSVLLMERFFNHVKNGKSHREAIRMARMDVRKKGYEHPFYWAAFILIGE